jgi:hypothetical protein
MIYFLGFHGTNFSATDSISSNGFQASKGDEHWLGDGIYFFLEGLSRTPEIQAEDWAKAQAWDNRKREFKYDKFVVFEAQIQAYEKECLDLRTSDGVEVFQYFKNQFITKIKKHSRGLNYLDGLIINLAKNEGIIPISLVIANFYIKFTKERIEKVNLRVQNCTICNVLDSNASIWSFRVIKTGNCHETNT